MIDMRNGLIDVAIAHTTMLSIQNAKCNMYIVQR